MLQRSPELGPPRLLRPFLHDWVPTLPWPFARRDSNLLVSSDFPTGCEALRVLGTSSPSLRLAATNRAPHWQPQDVVSRRSGEAIPTLCPPEASKSKSRSRAFTTTPAEFSGPCALCCEAPPPQDPCSGTCKSVMAKGVRSKRTRNKCEFDSKCLKAWWTMVPRLPNCGPALMQPDSRDPQWFLQELFKHSTRAGPISKWTSCASALFPIFHHH